MATRQPLQSESKNVRTAMWHSMRSILIVLGAVAGIGVLATLLYVGLPPIWYGWARLITDDYTSVTPGLWIQWGSLLAIAWALRVAYVLNKPNLTDSQLRAVSGFLALAGGLLILGSLPAECALWALMSPWSWTNTLSHRSVIEIAAFGTTYAVPVLYTIGVIGFLFGGLFDRVSVYR